MQFPFFYIPHYQPDLREIILDEDSSRHVVQVLRMNNQERLNLADGQGNLLTVVIIDAHKKHCRVAVEDVARQTSTTHTSIGISLLKNTNRFEWFLEKATEIGVRSVIPLICDRTEKERFRTDRLKQILVSAMLQSRQSWLPMFCEPVAFSELFNDDLVRIPHRYIAHCIDGQPRTHLASAHARASASITGDIAENQTGHTDRIILIGPEGDFTPAEIALALDKGFMPVSLGQNRLRTETAGMVAVTLLR